MSIDLTTEEKEMYLMLVEWPTFIDKNDGFRRWITPGQDIVGTDFAFSLLKNYYEN